MMLLALCSVCVATVARAERDPNPLQTRGARGRTLHGASCTQDMYTDLYGADLPGYGSGVYATSAQDCCDKCSAIAGCGAWYVQ